MSVWFRSGAHAIRFSTGAGQSLMAALAALASRSASNADDRSVTEWLEGYVEGTDIDLKSSSAALGSDDHVSFFLEVVRKFAKELALEDPDSTLCDINWDREASSLLASPHCAARCDASR